MRCQLCGRNRGTTLFSGYGIMTILTILILLALIAVVVSLVSGAISMMRGGKFDQQHSEQFMWARIGFQALALVLLAIALYVAD